MELTEQKTGAFTIINIIGRLDTTNYTILEKKFSDLLEGGQNHILVDCSQMDYVSSSGLRVLLVALKKIRLMDGKFHLCCLRENIREIFEISGFTSIFELYLTREDALRGS